MHLATEDEHYLNDQKKNIFYHSIMHHHVLEIHFASHDHPIIMNPQNKYMKEGFESTRMNVTFMVTQKSPYLAYLQNFFFYYTFPKHSTLK